MLNKCPKGLKVHTYDQVIHLVELCKIGGKTATEAAGEAPEAAGEATEAAGEATEF